MKIIDGDDCSEYDGDGDDDDDDDNDDDDDDSDGYVKRTLVTRKKRS